MFENDYDMALSYEDLMVLGMSIIIFILAFGTLNLAPFSFPVIVIVAIGWGIERFRRRPLPKQVLKQRFIYMAHIKILRNFVLLSIIMFDIIIIFVKNLTLSEALPVAIALIFSYIGLAVLSLIEFVGNIVAPDSLLVIPQLKQESEKEIAKIRFKLLYGTRFYVWLVISGLISLASIYIPVSTLINSKLVLINSIYFSLIIIAGLLYWLTYKDTLNFNKSFSISDTLKIVDYYIESDLKDKAYEVINKCNQENPNEIAILSKISFLYLNDEKYDKAINVIEELIELINKEKLNVPHTLVKSFLRLAIAYKAKGEYKKAYDAVTQGLTIDPENKVARRLRKELRTRLKQLKEKN